MTVVHVLNGPNLGRLGSREPEVYGTDTYADLVAACEVTAADVGLEVLVLQTEHEGVLIEWLHAAQDAGAAVILNAGALTHTSVAVRDAAAMLTQPLVEVHLSNVAAREAFRHTSLVSAVAWGVVTGLGLEGYRAALRALAGRLT